MFLIRALHKLISTCLSVVFYVFVAALVVDLSSGPVSSLKSQLASSGSEIDFKKLSEDLFAKTAHTLEHFSALLQDYSDEQEKKKKLLAAKKKSDPQKNT